MGYSVDILSRFFFRFHLGALRDTNPDVLGLLTLHQWKYSAHVLFKRLIFILLLRHCPTLQSLCFSFSYKEAELEA